MKKCAVAYITQKQLLNDDEMVSLNSVVQNLAKRYDVYIVTKDSNDCTFFHNIDKGLKILKVNDIFMESYQNYSKMCMSNDFYKMFGDYQYVLIIQPDVYVLNGDVDRFIDLGYDYYGAPVVNCKSWGSDNELIGCGGCSLRKVDKFINITKSFNEIVNDKYIAEDLYFCTNEELGLNKCTVDIGFDFCFSADTRQVYEYWFRRSDGRLPHFFHIFKKNDTWDFCGKYINTKDNTNIHFVTFANSSSNFSRDRVKYEAEMCDCFKSVNIYDETDFDADYWEKNKEHFDGTRGYGYWSWKTYFILKKMDEINDGDVIVYSDMGSMLLDWNINTLYKWINDARSSKCGILSPCYGPYKEINWTKYDAYDYINRTYNKDNIDIYQNAIQCGAGILVIVKNDKSRRFMEIWNDVMENHFDLITDSPSKLPNPPEFREHRHDQSVFSMLSKIYGVKTIETRNGILDKNNSPIICTRCKNDKETWKRPVRILYDHQIFDLQRFGGISKVITEYIKYGDRNSIVNNFTGSGNAVGNYNRTRSTVGVLNTNNENLLSIGFKNTNSNMTNREYTIKLLKEGNFDVFIPTFYDPYFLEYIGDKPFVLIIHDMITELYPQYFPVNDLQNIGKKTLAPLASHIITPSQNTKNDVIGILGIPEDKITVIPHAIDEKYGDEANKHNKTIRFPYILYVGQRNAYKRFDLFLKYSKPFLERHPEYKILCTGQKFSNGEIEFIRSIGLSEKIAYYHPQSDEEMAFLYKYAACFVYSSEYEGFGIPILEAYKMGCPVLLNNRSCFPEIAGNTPFFFEMNSISSSLDNIMEIAVNMSQDEKDCIIQSQLMRLKKFSWNSSIGKYLEIMDKTRK